MPKLHKELLLIKKNKSLMGGFFLTLSGAHKALVFAVIVYGSICNSDLLDEKQFVTFVMTILLFSFSRPSFRCRGVGIRWLACCDAAGAGSEEPLLQPASEFFPADRVLREMLTSSWKHQHSCPGC